MKDCAGASNGSALKRRILRQEALLRISEAVQEMIQPADLERVVKMCLEEMRRLGLDSRGLSIHRLIDQRTCTIETYLAAQSTPLSRQVTHNENVLRMWKGGRTVYRPDVEENPGGITPEGLEWTRECFGAAIRCILDVPHVNGTFAVSSVQPHAFSDADVEFVEEVAQVVSLGLSRVRDLENMAALVRHVPEGICLIDGSRRLVFANPAAQESLAAAAGLSVGDPVVQIGRYGLEEIVQGKPDGLPLEVHIPGSEQRTFEITGSLIREEVETGGCTLVIRDVTQDRRTLAKILRQYRLASLGQLAAGIAHDFNNSLTLIMGVAKLLDRRDDLPGDACEDVRSIVQQSQRASELVRQIRDFSRQSKAERCPLDLVPLLKETAELLGRAFPAGIEIRTEFAEKPMRAVGNAAQLQQAFHNLAINARDAMPEGGVLTVSLSQVRVCQERPGPIPRMSPGDWILLSVRDTGTGIPTEAMKHVFEPYFTTKGADEGTGLGLAQTYGIVQQHGGEIDVSSEAGGGTVFRIYLPEHRGAVEPAENEAGR